MIKIEFPSDRLDIARAMAKALHRIGYGDEPSDKTPERVTAAEIEQAMGDITGPSVEEVTQEDPKPTASLFESTEGEYTESSGDTNSNVNAESAFGTAQTVETSSPDPSTSGARVDEKGVEFNGAFCGEAKEPFYATGKMKGQWKKRKGVDQADYDAWYEGELGKLQTQTAETVTAPESFTETSADATAPVNAGAAFGAAPPPQATQEPVPTDAGSLMVWISEKQAAGLLTQDDVNEAYQATGVNTAALFGDDAAQPIAAIHTFLSAKVS